MLKNEGGEGFMALISVEYYRENKIRLDATDEIIEDNIRIAEDNISLVLNESLSTITVNDFLKKAIVTETEYLLKNDAMSVYEEGSVDSVSIGNFSYSGKSGGKKTDNNLSVISKRTKQYLSRGGYIYRGINTYESCGGVERCI